MITLSGYLIQRGVSVGFLNLNLADEAVEILTKVVAAINAGTAGSLSNDAQYQAKQALMYLKGRKDDNAMFRKPGDPVPRTLQQYEHP
ncbi:hypothetical protein ABEG90_10505 [Pantoea agglomerans]|uniref:hypothetical protein n=1 Tax=Enterobacter agglomerans TaxID=549 RepID=UPI003207A1DF